VRFFQAARLTAQIARTPVHLAQAVQNRPANAELCVRAELDALAAVKFLKCVNQSHYAGMHQVFEGNMPRQPLMNPAGNVSNLR
jgi:hypothetical protein